MRSQPSGGYYQINQLQKTIHKFIDVFKFVLITNLQINNETSGTGLNEKILTDFVPDPGSWYPGLPLTYYASGQNRYYKLDGLGDIYDMSFSWYYEDKYGQRSKMQLAKKDIVELKLKFKKSGNIVDL